MLLKSLTNAKIANNPCHPKFVKSLFLISLFFLALQFGEHCLFFRRLTRRAFRIEVKPVLSHSFLGGFLHVLELRHELVLVFMIKCMR